MTALDFLITALVIAVVKRLGGNFLILHASATFELIHRTGLRVNEIPLVLHLDTIGLVAALIVFRPNALFRPRILLTELRTFMYDLHR